VIKGEVKYKENQKKNVMKKYNKERARYLRKQQTETEKILWKTLRNRKICKTKFRRQHPIDSYVTDFCCEEKRLIIEIDGKIHDEPENKEYDNIRSEYLELKGYKIIRFRNDEIKENLKTVVKKIIEYLTPVPSP